MTAEGHIDAKAVGSDVARSRNQQWARKFSQFVISLFGLNRPGFLATEFVQSLNPVATIDTRHGKLLCHAGHGRLVWRAETFFTEEPDTIRWLDTLTPSDVYWDIGANVGLYAIYAAKFRRCRVVGFEPEAQNYALFMANIVLNDVGDGIIASPIALSDSTGIGTLHFRYLTKGGAYNLFSSGVSSDAGDKLPESLKAIQGGAPLRGFKQCIYGATVDELVFNGNFPAPTHIKLDVDGLEPNIVAGAARVLQMPQMKSVLVELNKNSAGDRAIIDRLAGYGYRMTAEIPSWASKPDRSREDILPCVNAIFTRE